LLFESIVKDSAVEATFCVFEEYDSVISLLDTVIFYSKKDLSLTASGNLMPPILQAIKAYATLQEIADQMRAVFGEYKEKIVI